jgi:translation initiation factor 2 beta subunit (eIF-2beta)/eIF-5
MAAGAPRRTVVATTSQPGIAQDVPINPRAGAAERYLMPQLLAVRTGRGKATTTSLPNIQDVAAALERPELYLVRHFQYSLSIQVGKGAQLSGNVDAGKLGDLLENFIKTWVLCQSPQCGLPECELVVEAGNTGPILLHCSACGHLAQIRQGVLTKQNKLVKFMRANRPSTAVAGTRPIAAGTPAHRQQQQQHQQQRTATVQLQTEGAFESHCRRLGRWIYIDSLRDARAGHTWLDCSGGSRPAGAQQRIAAAGGDPAVFEELPWELLVSVLRLLSAKDRYRCMQCCVAWLVGGSRAMEDGRRERRAAVDGGTIDPGSSSDESDPTSSDSSSSESEDEDEEGEDQGPPVGTQPEPEPGPEPE